MSKMLVKNDENCSWKLLLCKGDWSKVRIYRCLRGFGGCQQMFDLRHFTCMFWGLAWKRAILPALFRKKNKVLESGDLDFRNSLKRRCQQMFDLRHFTCMFWGIAWKRAILPAFSRVSFQKWLKSSRNWPLFDPRGSPQGPPRTLWGPPSDRQPPGPLLPGLRMSKMLIKTDENCSWELLLVEALHLKLFSSKLSVNSFYFQKWLKSSRNSPLFDPRGSPQDPPRTPSWPPLERPRGPRTPSHRPQNVQNAHKNRWKLLWEASAGRGSSSQALLFTVVAQLVLFSKMGHSHFGIPPLPSSRRDPQLNKNIVFLQQRLPSASQNASDLTGFGRLI